MMKRAAPGALTTLLLALACAAAGLASNPTSGSGRASQATASTAVGIDFDSSQWQVSDPNARREEYLGRRSLYLTSGFAVLKDSVFEDGRIDVDVATTGLVSFAGVIFRAERAGEHEIVYLRPFKSGQPDAVQYTPSFNGSAGWQLYSGRGYTAAAEIPHERWVHMRLEVSGLSLKVYLDNSDKPVLVNEDLRRGYGGGSLGLWGIVNGAHFSNFSYTPRPVAERRAPKPASFAPGVLTKWELSEAFDVAQRNPEELPSPAELTAMKWQPVGVEEPGMVVIDRYRRSPDKGGVFNDPAKRVGARPERKAVFARATLYSDRDQLKKMSLGYSDEVTVFLNGRPLFTGRSAYRYRDPGFLGIMDVEDDSIYLGLKKGRNDIVLGVAEYFGGWGFICRIDDPRGVRFE